MFDIMKPEPDRLVAAARAANRDQGIWAVAGRLPRSLAHQLRHQIPLDVQASAIAISSCIQAAATRSGLAELIEQGKPKSHRRQNVSICENCWKPRLRRKRTRQRKVVRQRADGSPDLLSRVPANSVCTWRRRITLLIAFQPFGRSAMTTIQPDRRPAPAPARPWCAG